MAVVEADAAHEGGVDSGGVKLWTFEHYLTTI
jgi:hypothetical protein